MSDKKTGNVKSAGMDAQSGMIREGNYMKINRNMSAVTTNRQLLRTENKLSLSMERLSSGYKINKAGDNPAGMAISHKMRAQINGLDQAESNADDGQSVLRIADGALNEVSNMLQRMRELSVQAANGTNSYSDRQSIQDEIDQLTQEVDRISKNTEYNEKTLLDGSANTRVYVTGAHADGTSYSRSATRLDVSEQVLPGDYKITVTDLATPATSLLDMSAANTEGKIDINGVSVEYKPGMDMETFYQNLRDAAEQAGYTVKAAEDADNNLTGAFEISSNNKGSAEELKITVSEKLAEDIGMNADLSAKQDAETKSWSVLTSGLDAKISITGDSGFADSATYSAQGNRIKITDNGGFSMDFLLGEDAEAGDTLTFDVTDIGAMSIQIGANQYQDMDVRIPEVSAESLYLETVDVAVEGGADKALVTLDEAIAKLGSVRSGIGAYTNRLEYATASLAETQEDMTTAYSGIMDTDMAEEMTEYTQQNVLEQAAMSVLSQANDLPQQVLSLLQK